MEHRILYTVQQAHTGRAPAMSWASSGGGRWDQTSHAPGQDDVDACRNGLLDAVRSMPASMVLSAACLPPWCCQQHAGEFRRVARPAHKPTSSTHSDCWGVDWPVGPRSCLLGSCPFWASCVEWGSICGDLIGEVPLPLLSFLRLDWRFDLAGQLQENQSPLSWWLTQCLIAIRGQFGAVGGRACKTEGQCTVLHCCTAGRSAYLVTRLFCIRWYALDASCFACIRAVHQKQVLHLHQKVRVVQQCSTDLQQNGRARQSAGTGLNLELWQHHCHHLTAFSLVTAVGLCRCVKGNWN